MRLSLRDAFTVIEEQQLKPPCHLWHYSFNIEYFFNDFTLASNGKHVRLQALQPLHQWAPLPIFTNYPLTSKSAPQNPFWVCRLSTFNEFLLRRSLQSHKPRKHFPTLQTFEKKDLALNGSLVIEDLHTNYFMEAYNSLKRPEHLGGSEVLDIASRTNLGLPPSWFKTISLVVNHQVVGIGLVIDDGKSQSLVNLASRIDKYRFGLYMLTLWIRECCHRNYNTVDAGISGTYGVYKNQIFLDSVIWQFE